MRESDIIALFFSRADRSGVPQDDCARIDAQHIVTTDAVVEGTHFRRDWSGPEDLAIKLWNVNLSDIAASGGDPDWCLLNLGLPANIGDDWLRAFARQFRRECERDGGRLVGGDTFRSSQITLSLTLAGSLWRSDEATDYRYLDRAGGAPGDAIYVTGAPGLSLLGYELLLGADARNSSGASRAAKTTQNSDIGLSNIAQALREQSARRGSNHPDASALYRAAVERHLRPRARLAESRSLRSNPLVRSMLDLSDGLYADLLRLAEANPGLRYTIDCDRLPLPGVGVPDVSNSPGSLDSSDSSDSYSDGREIRSAWRTLLDAGACTAADLQRLALGSGEELELLFSAKPGLDFAFPCAEIGRVTALDSSPSPSESPGARQAADADAEERVLLRNSAFETRDRPQWFQHF
ncbi:MAG: thiamine-phosphate kinase [bacterium]|nr:thiamine-phosphate kinase [bacterium]